ncbi:MAG: hypothetical protein E7425_02125 [Ruminococcaceae bacterium]|nr:hypothetical protein [Oscillospiraceae bacterium]
MSMIDSIKDELAVGLKLIAYKNLTIQLPPMAALDDAMMADGWVGVSEVTKGEDGLYHRYYYDTAQKNYALAMLDAATCTCNIVVADENDVLEKLSFPELKVLAGLIDKKSVSFIRIYSEKELAAASGEELEALNERNQKMIDEAEVALRKR